MKIQKMYNHELIHKFLNLRDMLLVQNDYDGNPNQIVFRVPIFRGVSRKNALKIDGHNIWSNSFQRAIDYAIYYDRPHILISYVDIPKNKFTVKYYNQMLGIGNDFVDYDFTEYPHQRPSFIIELIQ